MWSKELPRTEGVYQYAPPEGDTAFYFVREVERLGLVAELVGQTGSMVFGSHVSALPGYWLKVEKAEPPEKLPELPKARLYRVVKRDHLPGGPRYFFLFGFCCVGVDASGEPCTTGLFKNIHNEYGLEEVR